MSFKSMNTDEEWEKYGVDDPYFGVITHEKYRQSNLTDEALFDFFDSGEHHINTVLGAVRKYLDPDFTPRKSLDFGCGVGRVVIPLAKINEYVVGMDVSDSMLKEARKNCDLRAITNVSFIKSDDNLSLLSEKFDFIHSFIVFQHIPVERGEYILKRIIDHVEEGGVGALHFTYSLTDRMRRMIQRIPFAHNLINLAKGRSFFSPTMQTNSYDINSLFSILQSKGIDHVYVRFTNHSSALGVFLLFQVREAACESPKPAG